MWTDPPTPVDPNSVLQARSVGVALVPRDRIAADPFDASKEYGMGDAFGASFLKQSEIASTIHAMSDGDAETAKDLAAGGSFNPYSFLKQTYDAKTLAALAPAISGGEFEGAVSSHQVQKIADEIQWEMAQQQKMAASGLGALGGSFIAGLLNPTSYIPFLGAAERVGALGKVGLFALNASLSAGASEMVLQATQRNRDLSESIMNIGTAGIIGGGVGMFAAALGKSSHMNPNNPDNIFRRENLSRDGEVFRTADGSAKDDLERHEFSTGEGGSVGAAAVEGTGLPSPTIAASEPHNPVSKAVRAVTTWVNSQTVAGKLFRSTSDTVRGVARLLMDPGGILFTDHLAGRGVQPAEALKSDYMSEVDILYQGLENRINDLNMKLADKGGKKVDPADVLKASQRELFGKPDQAVDDMLASKYGEANVPQIKATAKANAEDIHSLNDVWEGRLIKEGLLQDAATVSHLKGEVDTLKTKIETMTFQTGVTPVMKDDVEVVRLRRMLADKQDLLRQEGAKPKPMGRNYGHAQMWNKEPILENPAEFRAFLMDVMAFKPDGEWLLEAHNMLPEELEALRSTDPTKYRSILEDWVGDEHLYRINYAEEMLAGATERRKQAILDLNEAARASGQSKRDEKALTLQQARAKRNDMSAKLTLARQERDQLRAEQRAFKEAATAARGQTLDRARSEGPSASEIRLGRAAEGVGKAEDKLTQTFNDAFTDPNTPVERIGDSGDLVAAADKVNASKHSLDAADSAARNDVSSKSTTTARSEGKAEEIANQLAIHDKRIETMEANASRMDARLRAVEAAEEEVTTMRKDLDDVVRVARRERKVADTSLKAVKKALRRERGSTPLEDVVNRVHDTLSTTGKVPNGIMDRILSESDRTSGRVKERGLTLDREQRSEAIDKGFLNDDLSNILYHQYESLAGELSVREAVGIGPNRRFKDWKDVLDNVREEFNQMISDATDPKIKTSLRKEREVMITQLGVARDRLKPRFDDDGAGGWAKWISSKFRQANYIRYGGGFTLSSMTDMASFNLQHGSAIKAIAKFGKYAIADMRQMFKEAPSDFQAMISSHELGMGAAASARRWGAEDLVHGANSGYGIGYGTTRKVTGDIDKGAESVSRFVGTWSGLPTWNRFFKTVAGIAMAHKLRDFTMAYDSLAPKDLHMLASLGIGKTEAKRIGQYVKEFGKVGEDGRWDPHMENWGETSDAVRAARDFRIAIQRDMNRAIHTPGIGDTPALMDKWWGKFLLTFQTFAFTFLNRYAVPMSQRLSMYRDRQAIMSLGVLLGSATFVMMGHDLINGRNPEDRFKPENLKSTIHEIIDRSGYLGWTSPFVDSGLKLTSPLTGYAGNNRYAGNNALTSLLGVNVALVNDVNKAASAVVSQGTDKPDKDVVKKLLVLAPLNSQFRLLYNHTIGAQ